MNLQSCFHNPPPTCSTSAFQLAGAQERVPPICLISSPKKFDFFPQSVSPMPPIRIGVAPKTFHFHRYAIELREKIDVEV